MTKSVDLPPTRTLAALYEKQGLLHQAEEIYRRLLEADPGQRDIQAALEELGKRRVKKGSPPPETGPISRAERDQIETVLLDLKRWAHAIRLRWDAVQIDGHRRLRMLVVLGPGPLGRDGRAVNEQIECCVGQESKKEGVMVEMMQALDEEAFVKALTDAPGRYDALIVNPESLDLGSLKTDRFMTEELPVFEVFFGHPPKDRTIPSPVSPVAVGHLAGFGVDGLLLTLRAAADTVREIRARGQRG